MDEREKKMLDLAIAMGQPHRNYLRNPLENVERNRRSRMVAKAEQVSAMLTASRLSEAGLQDRARGAMLGLAVGNLLGLPMESAWFHEIDQRYPDGVMEIYPREASRPMDDDLAQAVDLGEALVAGGDYVGEFASRLVRWARENGRGMGFLTHRVISLLEEGHPVPEAARIDYEANPIAPNGGVMRCAPVALARHSDPDLLVSDSAATCVVTHYAVTCQWSCIILNTVIALLLRGQEPDLPSILAAASADRCPDLLAQASRDRIPTEVFSAIAAGRPLPDDASWLRQDQVLIGHTLIALQTALWAAVTPLDFETALRQIVEGGGDTDTNGAVAGAVLGARYGASTIPQRWLDCVPQRERIEQLADGLLTLTTSSK